MKKSFYGCFTGFCIFSMWILLLFTTKESKAQLIVNPAGAAALAAQLAGPGLSVFNVTYTGRPNAAASFTANGTNLGLNSGILLATGPVNVAIGPNTDTAAGVQWLDPGYPSLDTLAGIYTFDAAVLEFDFIPQNDTVNFRYVFASEEYPEYVCSPFNDVFAFYISGPGIAGNQNMALIPGTTSAVAINSVNNGTIGYWGAPGPNCGLGYPIYYVDNTGGATIEYDGFTTVMTASAIVIPCQTYHLKLAIADAGDGLYDSGVFLEEGSLTTTPVVDAGPDVNFCAGQTVNIGADPISGWNYSWSPTTGINNPFISNPTLTLNPTTQLNTVYSVTATNGSCILSDVLNVSVTPIPTSTFTVTNVCGTTPSQITYSGNAPANATYTWSFGGGVVNSGNGPGPYSVTYPTTGTYNVTLNVNNNGCISPVTLLPVTVTSPPVAAFTVPANACLNDIVNLNFTGTNPVTTVSLWNFNGANVVSGSGLGPYQLSFSNTGAYNITLTMNEPGCPASQVTQTINVGSTPANAGQDVSACSGSIVNIGSPGIAGYVYSWSPATGLSNPNIADPTVTLTNSGTAPMVVQYILTATNGNCSGGDTVLVTINPPPVSLFSASPDTICAGDQLQFTFTGQASANANFNWNFSGGSIISGSGSGPFMIQFNNSGSNTISLDVNDYGCLSSVNDQVYVQSQPTAAFTLPASTCINDTIQLTYTGTAGASSVFNWNFGSANVVSGSNAGPYMLVWNTAGNYQVDLNISTGNCIAQNTQPISIGSYAANAGGDVAICSGANVTIGSNSLAGVIYSWSPLNGLSNPAIANPTVTLNNAGTAPLVSQYYLTATNGSCTAYDTVSVTVNPIPVSSFTALPDTICSGDSIVVNFTGQAGPNAIFNWNFSTGTVVSGSGSGPYQVSVNAGGNYNLSLDIDDIGCLSSANDQLFVQDIPSASLAALPDTICTGQQEVVTFNGTAVTYANLIWNFGNATVLNGNGMGPYTLDFPAAASYPISLSINQSGCTSSVNDVIVVSAPVTAQFTLQPNACTSDNVPVNYTGNGGQANYQWNFSGANIVSGSDIGPYSINWPDTGMHVITLTVQNYYCPTSQFSDTITTTQPSVDAGTDAAICSGASANIGGLTQAGYAYQWSPTNGVVNPNALNTSVTLTNNTQSTIDYKYQVEVTDPFGCRSTDSVTVTVAPLPQLHFASPPPQCVVGNSFNFTTTGPVMQGTQLHWNFGTNASIDSSNSPSPSSISYHAAGNYNVTLYGTYNGCVGPTEVQPVTVYDMPVATFTPDVTDGCEPLKVSFTNTSVSNTVNYTWLIDGNVFNTPQTDYTFTHAGTYDVTLTATSNFGCTTNDVKPQLINVYGLPVAEFTASPTLAYFPDSHINFTNLSQGAEFNLWNFGDGGTENFYDGEHFYADTGTYTVTLYVSTSHGCLDTIQGKIRIEGGFSFFVPNAFTPDDDGVNDSFQGYGTFINKYRMWIYDRWGKTIYYTEDYNKPWNGRMKSVVQNDTYVYRISVEDMRGKDHVYIGSVTLVK